MFTGTNCPIPYGTGLRYKSMLNKLQNGWRNPVIFLLLLLLLQLYLLEVPKYSLVFSFIPSLFYNGGNGILSQIMKRVQMLIYPPKRCNLCRVCNHYQ